MLIVNDTDISDFVTSIQRNSDMNQAPERLEVNAFEIVFNVGDTVVDFQDGKCVFKGYVFEAGRSRASGNYFVAYSIKKYLIKNYETGVFRDMTADSLIKKLCADANIPVGQIENTVTTIPLLAFDSETLIYDIMLTALNETVKRGGSKFIIQDKSGVIELKRRSENTSMFVFEAGGNILSAESSESIEDMFNTVKVVSTGEKKLTAVVNSNSEMIAKFGRMQKIESSDTQTTAEMQQIAKSVLVELSKIKYTGSITAPDISEIDAGMSIAVYDPATGLTGKYFVESVSHDEKSKTMDITLTLTDEIPKIEYSETSQQKSSVGKSGSTQKIANSTKVASTSSKKSEDKSSSVSNSTWERILNE